MKLGDLARLTTLLTRLARFAPPPPTDRRIAERRSLAVPGAATSYDLYAPRGERRATVVGLHGVLLAGKNDPRLVHFGRCLARSGVACIVPTLPGLAGCRFEAADLDILGQVLQAAVEESGRRVGIVGFCFGASYGLLAAARPELAGLVRFVLGFGPYASLRDVFAAYAARRDVAPVTDDEWDNWIFLHLVMAYRELTAGGTPAEPFAAVEDLLTRYCSAAGLPEKREFFERVLRPLDLVSRLPGSVDQATLEALSPAGKLGSLSATVSLIHDPRDIIVSAGESRRLAEELHAQPGGERHRLLVTTLVSHAELAQVLRPGELWRFLSALEPIVSVS